MALRLIVVSFIVGMILVTFGFEPSDVIDSFVHMTRRMVDMGMSDVRQVGRVLATGALVVLPIWLVAPPAGFAPGAVNESGLAFPSAQSRALRPTRALTFPVAAGRGETVRGSRRSAPARDR